MHFLITGGSGFIGSAFAKRLLSLGHHVTIFDDKPLEQSFRLEPIKNQISYKQIDFTKLSALKSEVVGFDVVAHFYFRANTSVKNPNDDFEKSILSTFNLLESIRANKIKKIIFLSGAAVYGNSSVFPTSETYGPLTPVSLYGAFKISSEALLSAYSALFDIDVLVFRLGNVVGPHMTRGIIFDLIKKLKNNSDSIEILGNGKQIKDFIYLDDCIDGILHVLNNSREEFSLFNLSSGTTISVNDIAKIVKQEMNLVHVTNRYSNSELGWAGDVQKVHFDISKIRQFGWSPKFDSKQAIVSATKDLL